MDFDFPEYETRQPLADGRSWTAKFDSWDERKDTCYYKVKLSRRDEEIGRFMVQVDTSWVGDSFAVPTFEPEIRMRLARIAAAGEANTEYLGCFRTRGA